jgi:hypothetical protein
MEAKDRKFNIDSRHTWLSLALLSNTTATTPMTDFFLDHASAGRNNIIILGVIL